MENQPIRYKDPHGLLTVPGLVPNPIYFPVAPGVLPPSQNYTPPSALEQFVDLYNDGKDIDDKMEEIRNSNLPEDLKQKLLDDLYKDKDKLIDDFLDEILQDKKDPRFCA